MIPGGGPSTRRPSHKGTAPILRQPVRSRRTQWRVLPNAHARCCQKLEGADRKELRLYVEGVQIHHPLETALGKLRQQPRVDGKIACRCLVTRLVWFFFNCHPTSRPMQTVYPPFFECFRRKDVTVSSSGTPVGIRHGSCASSRRKTSRFAFPTTMTRRRLGNGRRTSSMFEAMVPVDDTRDTTRRMSWRPGPAHQVMEIARVRRVCVLR